MKNIYIYIYICVCVCVCVCVFYIGIYRYIEDISVFFTPKIGISSGLP